MAAEFGVSRFSVFRHFKTHVTDARRMELLAGPIVVDDLTKRAAEESKSLLEMLQIVRGVLFRQFLNSAESGDRPGVANVGGRLLEALRELGKLTGEIREFATGVTINQTNFNIIGSPQFVALQDGLLKIARAHPQTRSDIVTLLESLDDGALPTLPARRPIINAEGIHE